MIKKIRRIVLLVLIIFALFITINGGNYRDRKSVKETLAKVTNENSKSTKTFEELNQEYYSQMTEYAKTTEQNVDIKILSQNPNYYKGKSLALFIKPFQVIDDGKEQQVLATIDDATLACTYNTGKIGTRIIENQDILIYGEFSGMTTYTTVSGAKKTIPLISVKYFTASGQID